jgi:hypothetical protein
MLFNRMLKNPIRVMVIPKDIFRHFEMRFPSSRPKGIPLGEEGVGERFSRPAAFLCGSGLGEACWTE